MTQDFPASDIVRCEKQKYNMEKNTKFKKGHIPKSKGKTWEELYGSEKAQILKDNLRKQKLGKSNPHTLEWNRKISDSHKGSKNPMYGKHTSLKQKEIMSKLLTGKARPKEVRRRISHSLKGHSCSHNTRIKISNANKGYICSMITKKKLSNAVKNSYKIFPQLKQLRREVAIKRIEIQKMNGMPLTPAIGKREMDILNRLEKVFNYKILRQHRVCSFFIDGYIPELKLAIEIDERRHFKNGKLLEKDVERQHIIEKKLNCKFLRIGI